MGTRSYPIRGCSRRYWSDADRVTMVSNLMETAALLLHGVAQRSGNLHLEGESVTLAQWADEMLTQARVLDTEPYDG